MDQWESIAAFGDLAELEHVCELLQEDAAVTPDLRGDPIYLTGEKSTLVNRLNQQAIYSERVCESVRLGLYQRTWIAELFWRLFVLLDGVTEHPKTLAAVLPEILLDLHKVLIAAHEIYDDRSRKVLLAAAAKAEENGIQKGLDSAARRRSEQSRKAVACRTDQKDKKHFCELAKKVRDEGKKPRNISELLAQEELKDGWEELYPTNTLKGWAKEVGFEFKAGRTPKKTTS